MKEVVYFDPTALAWPVNLTVIWHYILDACELMHILLCRGKIAVIMLKIVGATIHSFVAGMTRHLWFVCLWLIGSAVTMVLCILCLWMEEATSRYWGWLWMYWMIGRWQLTGLSISLGLDIASILQYLTQGVRRGHLHWGSLLYCFRKVYTSMDVFTNWWKWLPWIPCVVCSWVCLFCAKHHYY